MKQAALVTALFGLGSLMSCKHRSRSSVPEEWEPYALDTSTDDLQPLLQQSKSLSLLEHFEDGFVITDSLSFRLDLATSSLAVERRFDPVPFTPEEPIVIQKTGSLPTQIQTDLLQGLALAKVRQVPRCNPYGAVDGGYGGRFLILVDGSGQEHRFGASDAECAATDQDCSGPCISLQSMDLIATRFASVLPIPEKPRTVFRCAADSPLPCAQTEATVFGAWEGSGLRADIRRTLAQKLCYGSAFSLEPVPDGTWSVQNSSRERVGSLAINAETRTVSCLSRVP